ncbi:MAG: hypothetical protein EPO13_00265 [Actinomycetota bacterium]|nr:MAG: hypothetical protein EPO13_00265 [Actinomycetota bacterium]
MKRHDLDVFSLMAGLLFVVLGGGYALAAATETHLDPRFVLPAALVALGVGGLVGSVVGARRRRDSIPSPDAMPS